jgi:hypothetical protein
VQLEKVDVYIQTRNICVLVGSCVVYYCESQIFVLLLIIQNVSRSTQQMFSHPSLVEIREFVRNKQGNYKVNILLTVHHIISVV